MKFICNFKIYGINLLATWSTEARKLLLLLKCRVSSLKYTETRPVQLLTSTSLEIAGVLCPAKRKSELCHAALSTGRKYNSNFEVILGSRHKIRHQYFYVLLYIYFWCILLRVLVQALFYVFYMVSTHCQCGVSSIPNPAWSAPPLAETLELQTNLREDYANGWKHLY